MTSPEAPGKPGLAVTDAPLPEMVERLFRAIERSQAFLHQGDDIDGRMRAIRECFPAPQYLMECGSGMLERFGLPGADADYYAMIPLLTRASLARSTGGSPRLDSDVAMAEYLAAVYVGRHVECFYAVLLDARCRLIRTALIQRGDVDETAFYLGRMLEAALQADAGYVVLAHNHPAGTPYPSRDDLHCTLKAMNALAPLRIPLLDHMIVAGESVIGIRGMGLLPDALWTAVAPGDRFVNGWLRGKKT
jgi:DNA repair protein RadC